MGKEVHHAPWWGKGYLKLRDTEINRQANKIRTAMSSESTN